MQKIKNYRSADCVVGGFRYNEGKPVVGSLLLGLYDDDGKLNHVGFTSTIKREDKPALTKKLEKLIAPPGFTGNAPGGPSRWSTKRSAEWQPLKPKLVVEVCYDHFTGDRFRHGTQPDALAAGQVAEAMHDGAGQAEEGGSAEAAEIARILHRRGAVRRQHLARQIERAGDQDARRAARARAGRSRRAPPRRLAALRRNADAARDIGQRIGRNALVLVGDRHSR